MKIVTTTLHTGISGTLDLNAILIAIQERRVASLAQGLPAFKVDLPANLTLLQQRQLGTTLTMNTDIDTTADTRQQIASGGTKLTPLFAGEAEKVDIRSLTLPELLEFYLSLRAHSQERYDELRLTTYIYRADHVASTPRTKEEAVKYYYHLAVWRADLQQTKKKYGSKSLAAYYEEIQIGAKKWKEQNELKELLRHLNERIPVLKSWLSTPLF